MEEENEVGGGGQKDLGNEVEDRGILTDTHV